MLGIFFWTLFKYWSPSVLSVYTIIYYILRQPRVQPRRLQLWMKEGKMEILLSEDMLTKWLCWRAPRRGDGNGLLWKKKSHPLVGWLPEGLVGSKGQERGALLPLSLWVWWCGETPATAKSALVREPPLCSQPRMLDTTKASWYSRRYLAWQHRSRDSLYPA